MRLLFEALNGSQFVEENLWSCTMNPQASERVLGGFNKSSNKFAFARREATTVPVANDRVGASPRLHPLMPSMEKILPPSGFAVRQNRNSHVLLIRYDPAKYRNIGLTRCSFCPGESGMHQGASARQPTERTSYTFSPHGRDSRYCCEDSIGACKPEDLS